VVLKVRSVYGGREIESPSPSHAITGRTGRKRKKGLKEGPQNQGGVLKILGHKKTGRRGTAYLGGREKKRKEKKNRIKGGGKETRKLNRSKDWEKTQTRETRAAPQRGKEAWTRDEHFDYLGQNQEHKLEEAGRKGGVSLDCPSCCTRKKKGGKRHKIEKKRRHKHRKKW